MNGSNSNAVNSREKTDRSTARRRTQVWSLATAGTVGVLLLGITVRSAVSTTIAVGDMSHSEVVGGPATVAMRTLEFAPGEVSVWHYHTGLGVLNVVKSGTLVIEDGCGGDIVYGIGDAFLEPAGRVHRGRNPDESATVTVAQTFLVPAGSGLAVATPQLCGQPLSVDECRDGGWRSFSHPKEFANQGDCEQYVIVGK